MAAYCGAKSAVIRMTEAVAREVASDGITVNAVCPGRTRTAVTDSMNAERSLDHSTRTCASFEGDPPEKVARTIRDAAEAGYTGRAVDVG